jgi:hypothetical protein
MCTVTLVARRNGYMLGMNRDEKRTRATARPPARHRLGGRDALLPSEPGGGTWMGVNDAGATVALINWYSVPARVTGRAVSRGEVVKQALRSGVPSEIDEALARFGLDSVNPFRLIGVFLAEKAVIEWRWDLARVERLEHRWRTNTWISSGFDEPGAQQTRGKAFGEALRQESAGQVDWLRRLHRSHGAERGPYSTCMHRADAGTVSYTEVAVSPRMASIRYVPGAPCCTAPLAPLRLPVRVAPT